MSLWMLLSFLLFMGAPMLQESEQAALRSTDHFLLATMIFHEGRSKSQLCRTAMAYTAVNRMKLSEARGKDSDLTNELTMMKKPYVSLHDKSVADAYRKCRQELGAWHDAQNLAWLVIAGQVPDPTAGIGGADHFEDKANIPVWASKAKGQMEIDGFIFYRLGGQ